MENLNQLKQMSGILNESKYGPKFDRFKTPFKVSNKDVVDKDSRHICECETNEMAKELCNILNDIRKMREICEKFISLAR